MLIMSGLKFSEDVTLESIESMLEICKQVHWQTMKPPKSNISRGPALFAKINVFFLSQRGVTYNCVDILYGWATWVEIRHSYYIYKPKKSA